MRILSRRILIGVSGLVLLLNLLPTSMTCLCEAAARRAERAPDSCCRVDAPPCCASEPGHCPRMQATHSSRAFARTCACQIPGASSVDSAVVPSTDSLGKQTRVAELAFVTVPPAGSADLGTFLDDVRSRGPSPPGTLRLHLRNSILRI